MRNLKYRRGLTAIIVTPILLLISVGAASQGKSPAGVGPPRPTVISVTVTDLSTGLIADIVGTDFESPNGAVVEVTLGGVPLTVDIGTVTDQFISASSAVAFLPGDYLLVVVTSVGADEYGLTVGAVGPQGAQGIQGIQGEQGNPGPPGADGADGADGAGGADGADGMAGADGQDGTSCSATQGTGSATINCEDGTSATVFDGADGADGATGATGPRGAPGGLQGYEVVTMDNVEIAPGGLLVPVTVSCPAGKVALGGGYRDSANILFDPPLPVFSNGLDPFTVGVSGWRVDFKPHPTDARSVTVSVTCANSP